MPEARSLQRKRAVVATSSWVTLRLKGTRAGRGCVSFPGSPGCPGRPGVQGFGGEYGIGYNKVLIGFDLSSAPNNCRAMVAMSVHEPPKGTRKR